MAQCSGALLTAAIAAILLLISHATLLSGQITGGKLKAQAQRFWDSTGVPIALVQYEFTASDPLDKSGAPNRAALLFRLLGINDESRDTSWTEDLVPTGKKEQMGAFGTVALPLEPWLSSWKLVSGPRLSQDVRRGRPAPLQPLPPGGVVVSDLALGATESRALWQYGENRVRISPSREFGRKDSIFVFYQVLSSESRPETRTWLTVTNVTDPQLGVRVIQLNFAGRLARGVNVNELVLDMSRQEKGRYLLELQVSDSRGGGASVRPAEFEIR